VLTGAGMLSQIVSWVADRPEPTNEGHGFIAIDVGQMMPLDEFKARMDWAIGQIKAAPPAKGATRVYLPGEMEWERRDKALREGIRMPEEVLRSLAGLAQDVGLDFESLFR